MLTLALVGIVSGLITAISPCVLPVLPAILASSVPTAPKIPVAVGVGVGAAVPKDAVATPASAAPATSSRRRPLLVVAGLVTSFAFFTLLGGTILGALNLREDVLRWAGIVVLVIVGIGLLIPAIGHVIERPFQSSKMPKLGKNAGGFVTGLALGLIFVPCAGPILAAITVLAATNGLSVGLVVLTLAFSVGIAIPLLIFALAGEAIVSRVKAVRNNLGLFRQISGGILVVTAFLIATNVFEPLQRIVPPVLDDAQSAIENNSAVQNQLDALAGREDAGPASGDAMTFDECANSSPAELHNCGPALSITGIESWINTPGDEAVTLDDLKGKVVLLDFWTYSCINCQRTLPFITAWYDKYKDDGLVVVGVHTPEFAFEHVRSNVVDATDRFGIHYPVALDNDFKTWREWHQRFWPAHYLIDKDGIVRQVHYGEGAYAETETLIQRLLDAPPSPTVVADPGAHTAGRSPETYVGYKRLIALENSEGAPDTPYDYTLVTSPEINHFSLGGTWTVKEESAVAGNDAVLRYHFYAADVFLVLGGEGTVTVTREGDPGWSNVVDVSGAPTLYTLYSGDPIEDQLTLEFSPGVEAFAFTFG